MNPHVVGGGNEPVLKKENPCTSQLSMPVGLLMSYMWKSLFETSRKVVLQGFIHVGSMHIFFFLFHILCFTCGIQMWWLGAAALILCLWEKGQGCCRGLTIWELVYLPVGTHFYISLSVQRKWDSVFLKPWEWGSCSSCRTRVPGTTNLIKKVRVTGHL